MIECLGPEQMSYFLSLLGEEVTTIMNAETIIVHSLSGDVVWTFDYVKGLFCR